VVGRILAGKAPANLLELLRSYFGLHQDMWGKDAARGAYSWLQERERDEEALADEREALC
jgi:hypothetical protein